MDTLENRIIHILCERQFCTLAASDGRHVENAAVGYLSDGLTLYFGTYADTLKSRFLTKNDQVALCVDNILQIHGKARPVSAGTPEYQDSLSKFLAKFPNFGFFFDIEHVWFRVDPQVIWLYKGWMHRESLVLDEAYYRDLQPYETNPHFFGKITN